MYGTKCNRRIEEFVQNDPWKKIIDDVSLQLYPGQITGFLGPNGAGKTTTIRMMVGLMKKAEEKS